MVLKEPLPANLQLFMKLRNNTTLNKGPFLEVQKFKLINVRSLTDVIILAFLSSTPPEGYIGTSPIGSAIDWS